MSLPGIVVQGTLSADGTLQLDEKPNLPAGRVQVILQLLPDLPVGDPFWEMMKSIWAGQQQRGHVPRNVEEVQAELRESRQGWATRQEEIERLQDEAHRVREQQP